MDISLVTFPLYKLKRNMVIETSPLGIVKVITRNGEFILDDKTYNGTFPERRLMLHIEDRKKVYKLKEQVLYLRQLIKYKTGTKFIDHNGNILEYKKTTKLFNVLSKKILRKKFYGTWTIINIESLEQTQIIGTILRPEAQYASIIYTTWGALLYDLTSVKHKPFKRKL